MKKLRTLAVGTVVALAFSPVVFNPAHAQSLATSNIIAQDHSMRSSKLIGMEVFNQKGEKIGKIEDILVKGSATEPLAVLSVGRFTGGGDKMVAVPLSHITMNGDHPGMAATKTEMASMAPWQFIGLNGGGG